MARRGRNIICFSLCNRPYLEASKRELLADYSLPIAVLVMSFVGSFLFADVNRKWSSALRHC